MTYEVVVVGGGIGGLTTAALLARRGVNVCLLERQSQPGGCAVPFDKFGYRFESGAGLYPLWGKGEIHDRIFDELGLTLPEVRPLEPSYVVRLPDQSETAITTNREDFADRLRSSFPECAERAIEFYREAEIIGTALLRAADRVPDLSTATNFSRTRALRSDLRLATRMRRLLDDTTVPHLQNTSLRFRRFIDAQLQMFAQCGADDCAYLYACVALTLPRRGMFAIKGGAGALAEMLTNAITQNGGTVRLNNTALRLAFDSSSQAVGVDLLTGETIEASRAIVSNLTAWDTYGKLIGLNRTPSDVRKRLSGLRGWGAYLLYLGVDEAAMQRLPANHVLAITDLQEEQSFDPTDAQLLFGATPSWDARGPEGKRAVTVHMFTDVEDWFTFHKDETEHEEKDQSVLESLWQRLHRSIRELGDGAEVIETATPQTYYELTRRKLGMVGGVGQSVAVSGSNSISHRTTIPNVFMVGDTTFPGAGIAAVSQSALIVANTLSPQH